MVEEAEAKEEEEEKQQQQREEMNGRCRRNTFEVSESPDSESPGAGAVWALLTRMRRDMEIVHDVMAHVPSCP